MILDSFIGITTDKSIHNFDLFYQSTTTGNPFNLCNMRLFSIGIVTEKSIHNFFYNVQFRLVLLIITKKSISLATAM